MQGWQAKAELYRNLPQNLGIYSICLSDHQTVKPLDRFNTFMLAL